MKEKKKLFSEGKIEIERVINEHGDATFQVRFLQNKNSLNTYYGDQVLMVDEVVIDHTRYVPVVEAYRLEGGKEGIKRVVRFNVNEDAVSVEEGKYLNL